MGLYYDDLSPGRTWETATRTVTDADLRTFASLTGDDQPLHSDPSAALAAGFHGVVAHGVLGLAMAAGLVSRLELTRGTLAALAGVEWQFRAPVYPGDTLSASVQVASRRPTRDAGRGLIVLDITLRNQRREVVQQGQFIELVRRRV